MDVEQRLIDFAAALSEYRPGEQASWQLAQMFNALLEEVKRTHGDDPVLAAIRPVEESSMPGVSMSDCGTLRAAAMQLRNVVRGT